MTKKLLLLTVVLMALTSCEEEFDPTLSLAGNWEYLVNYDNGFEQQVLAIESDSSIVIRQSLFGVQPNTTPDQLNATIKYYGDLTISGDQLEFGIYEFIYMDYYLEIGPDTLANNTVFFDQCTYQIVGDSLILNYTTYPADFPVPSTRKFVRIK